MQVDGDFVWETVLTAGGGGKGKSARGDKDKKSLHLKADKSLPHDDGGFVEGTPER